MPTKYRNNGATGAILDEYERAINELKTVIKSLTPSEIETIVDHETPDKSCESIQSILTHVIKAGYHYVVEIRNAMGENLPFINVATLNAVDDYTLALDEMFQYNEALFEDYPSIKWNEHDNHNKINVVWGQQYDVEQLYEHAIVHILRHRRQIERFILKLKAL